jgi:hypothetical protein
MTHPIARLANQRLGDDPAHTAHLLKGVASISQSSSSSTSARHSALWAPHDRVRYLYISRRYISVLSSDLMETFSNQPAGNEYEF